MPSPSSRLHLGFDESCRFLIELGHRAKGTIGGTTGLGDSLPGGQVHLAARVFRDQDGYEYLRSGDPKHSMWRTVEWKLLQPIVGALEGPVLDLGCGDGAFGKLFRDHIDYGIDGDADAVGQCDRQVYQNAVVGDLREKLAVADGSIESIFSNSTLEHVKPLGPAIAAASRALRSGGKLIATVPTNGLTEAFVEAYGEVFARRLNGKMGHYNLLPWAEWESLLRENGFSTVSFRGYLSRPSIHWFAQRSLTPWPQIGRRFRDRLWHHDLPILKGHIEESLQVTREDQTTCVLIEAVKG